MINLAWQDMAGKTNGRQDQEVIFYFDFVIKLLAV